MHNIVRTSAARIAAFASVLAAAAIITFPRWTSANEEEFPISATVPEAKLQSAKLVLHVQSGVESANENGYAFVRDDQDRQPGTHAIQFLKCGRNVRKFEVWTQRLIGAPKRYWVIAQFSVAGDGVAKTSRGSVRRGNLAATPFGGHGTHHDGSDFNVVVNVDCTK